MPDIYLFPFPVKKTHSIVFHKKNIHPMFSHEGLRFLTRHPIGRALHPLTEIISISEKTLQGDEEDKEAGNKRNDESAKGHVLTNQIS